MPYVPIFSSTPASSTEPTVGAAVCASGSHVCSGHIGALTARPSPMARTATSCTVRGMPAPPRAASATRSVVPVLAQTSRKPSSITTEPSTV